jgi:hypothetical protein
MSIVLENLEDLKAHIEQFGTTALYFREGSKFVILAARLSWKGEVVGAKGKSLVADDLEAWLKDHGAKRILKFASFEELFK